MAQDDINFNIKLTQKQKQTLWLVLLVLIPLFLAVFFRAYPAELPITDVWAESTVNNFYQQQLTAQVKANFPNLPDAQVQSEVAKNYQQLRETDGARIEQEISQVSEQFKQQLKNEQGETYLLAIDPWYYLQMSENKLTNGHAGTQVKNSTPWDGHRYAPVGFAAENNWHSQFIIILWTLLSLFDKNMTLMGASFWVPLIVASLATIPAFFIARRKAGNLGGFIAAVIVGVHSAFLSRTPAGFSDTDAYNVFFPLLVAWLFLEAFEAKDLWKKLALASGAGVALGIYSKVWIGFWYILDILMVVLIGYIGYTIFRILYYNYQQKQHNKKQTAFFKSNTWKSIKQALLVGATFYVATGIVVTVLFSIGQFINAPLGFLKFAQLKDAVNPTLWPNVLTTVAELNEVNFAGVMTNMGGKFLYWLALMGVVVSVLPKQLKGRHWLYLAAGVVITAFLTSSKILALTPLYYLVILGIPLAIGLFVILRDEDIDIKYALFLLVWFIAAMYTTTKGVRFTLVLVPPLAIAIGTTIGLVHRYASDLLAKELDISRKIIVPVLAIILCLVLVNPLVMAHRISLNEVPSMSDGWYESLTNIRDNSGEDAIITSWWDFGHWFKEIAERAVTFDGGSQNTPMAHWVGKLMLTTDEDESTSILRMLNCGSYTGFDLLNAEINDPLKSKKLMDEIILLNKAEAQTRLEAEGVGNIDAILAATHCDPPESFLITSQDMVGKAGVWGHFGSWDFERAYIYQDLRNKPQAEAVDEMVDRFGYTEQEASTLWQQVNLIQTEREANNWISPWPAYVSGWMNCQVQNASVNTSALGLGDEEGLVNRTVAACPTSLRVSSTANGDVVIESIIIDLENPEITRFRYGVYRNGVRYQATDEGKPGVLYFGHEDADDGLEHITFDGTTSGMGLLYDESGKRAMLMDPLHAGSVFTQLFYLNGKYNDNYELFSDRTTFNGQRVIVWKATWN